MSTDADDAADEGSADDALLSLYRRYLGEPERATDVYVGFALFFGGIALGALGLGVFLWSVAVEGTALFWRLREVALVLAFVGLPAFILSVVVLLPVGRRARRAGAAGASICLAAVGLFVAVYPAHWNVQSGADYSAQGVAVYAAGLAVLVASTGSALVAHHIERARPATGAEGAAGGATGGRAAGEGSATEEVTDERVRRDIEEAMESAELTWGGVEKTDTKRLTIDAGDAEAEIDRSGFDSGAANTARSESVDDAVAGLRALQGGERETGTSEGVDEQTAALRELRERQRARSEEESGLVGRLKERLGVE